ncbi:phosphatidate cytidylyltransferase [Cephaloticoccus primus]|uniref:Phosphatidate cytidylyltransferase n=1 Tax=Cephaloticoccus primus TaxID=1548207 RepID=A0A139SQA5_9BACT|nr:phosphatidate cytidylyltransferase [Cephaloticoccus primus]KXU36670.1 phosphatidate cytidylyltransferase [Cephaloticoccus primus]
MTKRILSTVLLWLIVIGALWLFRTTGAVLLVGLISALTLLEFYRLLAGAGWAPFAKLGALLGGLITVAPWLAQRFGLPTEHLLALAAVIFAIRILGERAETRVESLAATLFGQVYVAFMLQYLVRILIAEPALPERGLVLFVWTIAVAKFCDVGALLSGLALGRHLMSPTISPKKTWEGAAGGILTSMVVGALIAWLSRGVLPPNFSPLLAAALAAPVAAVAIVSDLVESILKRRAALKDSGGLIPGIGGMFDLSDSLILAAPVACLLFALLS